MGRAWRLATIVALAPLLAGAQQPDATDPAEQAPVFTSRQVQGSLQEWDADSGQLVIDDDGTRTRLELQEGSTVFIEGRLGQRTELAEGQLVRAAYQERDGKQYVRWIEVTAPKKAPARDGKKTRGPRSESPPTAPAFGPYEGRVEEVLPDQHAFVLASVDGPWTIELAEAVLLVKGEKITVDALQAGMRVRAEWVAGATPRTLRLEVIDDAPAP